jgi:hypothetical protein
LVLTMQAARRGTEVRILLCDEGGNLALEGLIKAGATVTVCAIFLPNRDYGLAALIPEVGIARPDEIASSMRQDGVRYFSSSRRIGSRFL